MYSVTVKISYSCYSTNLDPRIVNQNKCILETMRKMERIVVVVVVDETIHLLLKPTILISKTLLYCSTFCSTFQ